jgi:hydroxyethylthiazole kinase-like uncharacterized protein yjeF
LPSPEGGDKEARGQVLVVGGSLQNPGAVMLAAVAAMRCGAGKLQIATVEGAAPSVAPLVPEAFVQGLPQTAEGAVSGAGGAKAAELAAGARAVLVGPGVTDGAECSALLETLLPAIPDDAVVVLDAYALAHVGEHRDSLHRFGGRAVVTPNMKELALMSGVERDEVEKDPAGFAHRAAVELGATVLLGGTESWVADPDGRVWCDTTGGIGLAGSGSGDAQAGLVAGLAARGATPTQAAVWAAHVHGRAGDRLAARLGRLGYLAREVVDEIPLVLVEIEA